MIISTKFKIQSITRQAGWGDNKELYSLKLNPVTNGSLENSAFYAATPGGIIELLLVKPDAVAHLSPGDEMYVDFALDDGKATKTPSFG